MAVTGSANISHTTLIASASGQTDCMHTRCHLTDCPGKSLLDIPPCRQDLLSQQALCYKKATGT